MLLPRPAVEGQTWPPIPGPFAARLMAMQYQLERSQWLPAAELERLQLDQARMVLAHALATVPHYRAKYGDTLLPDTLAPDWWRQLPLLERTEIQEHFEALKSSRVPPSHGKTVRYGSSGSTGRPIQVLGTEVTHFFWLCLTLRDHLWQRRDLQQKHGAIRSKVQRGAAPGWGEWSAGFRTGSSTLLNIQTDVDSQLDWLAAEAPAYLTTHPSNLRALLRRAGARGLAPPGVVEVRTFGEMLRPDLRPLVQETWGAKLTDMYSAEEVGYIALQCPEGDHYHIQGESLLVEILDDAGRPCRPGEVGRVVVTTLQNFAMPLIRYRILDHAEVGEPCPCGRGLPTIRRISGRSRNMLTLPDGRQHWPSFPVSDWLAVSPVRQFQLVQQDLYTIEIKLACPRPLSRDEEAAIEAMLAGKLQYPFRFLFHYQDDIPCGPNNKFEDFVSRLEPPGAPA